MDFKVCGTEQGITALQMDNKATWPFGRYPWPARSAQAKEGRAFIMKAMLEAIDAPRDGALTLRSAHRDHPYPCPIRSATSSVQAARLSEAFRKRLSATIEVAGRRHRPCCFRRRREAALLPRAGDPWASSRFPRSERSTTAKSSASRISARSSASLPARMACSTSRAWPTAVWRKVEDVLNIGDIVKVEVIEVSDSGKIGLDRVDKPDVVSSERPSRHHDDGDRRGKREGSNGGRKPRRRHNGSGS